MVIGFIQRRQRWKESCREKSNLEAVDYAGGRKTYVIKILREIRPYSMGYYTCVFKELLRERALGN